MKSNFVDFRFTLRTQKVTCLAALLLASGLSASANSLSEKTATPVASVKNVEQQQIKVIKGMVQDKNHEPIIGATVLAKGTSIGTITDMDGLFTLEIPAGVTKLSFSYIGYSPLEVDINQQSKIDVTLFEDVVSLQDVVYCRL